MKKKVLALVLVLAMAVCCFAACGKKADEQKATPAAETVSKDDTNPAGAATQPASDEIVSLKWIVVGGGMPANYDAWKANIDKYLADKIGVNIDVEVISWGDWDNRRNLAVNSGEYFDILFTDSGRYVSESKLGAFMDITDLVGTAAPELKAFIPQAYWDAVKVDGKIYSVPTYKDSSATQYMVWDNAVVDKYGIDINNCTSFASLTSKFEEVLAGEGTAPVIVDQNGFEVILSVYDQMGAELPAMGVRYDDGSRKVVNVLEQPEVIDQLKVIHEWYEKGIINADAPTTAETPSYRPFFTAQGWSGAAKTTWGPNMGCDATAVQFISPIVSNTTVRGSLNAIYSGCEHPEKALAFLQLMNTDSYVRDAFYYGLEGENFNYTADGKIDKLNSDWTMAGYTQGTFFNVSQLSDTDFNQWDEVKQLNDTAAGSVLLGFDFDTTNVETELATCRSIYQKYKSFLLTGVNDPAEMVATITAELNEGGFQKILDEAQKQIDAYFN